jgi:hypothetical protein
MSVLGKTRVWLAVLLTATAGVAAGCGEDDFENEPRPPVPITLTGVIQEMGVTVSPNGENVQVGAGPVRIEISNQTDDPHTITLEGDTTEERVGPVQPGDVATIQKTLERGTYEVRAGSEQAVAREIPAATLEIGPQRESSSDRLLLP